MPEGLCLTDDDVLDPNSAIRLNSNTTCINLMGKDSLGEDCISDISQQFQNLSVVDPRANQIWAVGAERRFGTTSNNDASVGLLSVFDEPQCSRSVQCFDSLNSNGFAYSRVDDQLYDASNGLDVTESLNSGLDSTDLSTRHGGISNFDLLSIWEPRQNADNTWLSCLPQDVNMKNNSVSVISGCMDGVSGISSVKNSSVLNFTSENINGLSWNWDSCNTITVCHICIYIYRFFG